MALPRYKDIIELLKKGATVEAQEKILELRESAIDLQEENLDLKEKLKDLQNKLAVKASLEFDGNVYFMMQDKESDGPFCPSCYDSESKLIRVHPVKYAYRGSEWECKVCKSNFKRN